MAERLFDLHRPRDLLSKLFYDVERLKNEKFNQEMAYAALDCANDAWHLVDWVLASISAEKHLELCGYIPEARKAPFGFRDRQIGTLPKLGTCERISIIGKHRVVTRSKESPDFGTTSSVIFYPPFDSSAATWEGKMRAVLRVVDTWGEMEAPDFFAAAADDWERFLQLHDLL